MDPEDSSDTLLLTAEGPVEKPLTYEEDQVDHRDVDAERFTARTLIEGHQEVSVMLNPRPDLEAHVASGFEDNHSDFVSWIFASYLDNADEGWYPIRYDEWDVTLTTAKPGEHPGNLFRLCAEDRAASDGTTTVAVLRDWANEEYFDTEKVTAALQVAESN